MATIKLIKQQAGDNFTGFHYMLFNALLNESELN